MIDYDALRTLPELFFSQVAHYDRAPYMWAKRDGAWRSMTWQEVADRVAALAQALRGLGIESGDRVALVAENRPEWTIADLAVMTAGAVTVPAYTTNTVESHRHVLEDSGARLAVVSSARLAERLLPACRQAGITRIVSMEPLANAPEGIEVLDFHALVAENAGPEAREAAEKRGREPARDHLACIIYTSGTGGVPAGVKLSHGNILCNVMGAHDFLLTLPGLEDGKELFLSFLPLSHSYEHTVGQFVPISIGAQVFYAEGLDRLIANIEEVRPTIMTAVPRLYETIRGRILHGAAKAGGLKEKLLHKAVEIGSRRYEDPARLGLGDRLLDPLLDRLVRAKVQQRFGGRLKAFVSGGAPLNYEVGLFFTALGVRVLQGYGQTEAAPVVSVNRPDNNKLWTVGPPLKGVDVEIAADGEILVRGELVMLGYWNRPEQTAATVVDGWLHTGDVGALDEEGCLMITDRKKDIIVNSGGDNISPQRVEGILCLEPEIQQAMVIGDKRPHLVALVTPDPDWARQWADAHGADSAAIEDLAENDAFRHAIDEAVSRANKKLSTIERVRRFTLTRAPFTVDNGMLTPSMKTRRHVVLEAYGEALERLYGG